MTPADARVGDAEAVIAREPTLLDRITHRIFWLLAVVIAKVWLRLRVEGADRLPASGAYVIAPVHRSGFDSPLTGVVCKRRIRYMGKDSLWKKPWQARLLTALGGFPVNRGTADREALRACMQVIERGEPLVMFPEGTRRSGPVIEDLFDGPAYVAARTGVPIVPVGIGGTEDLVHKRSIKLRPRPVHMVFGEPLEPPRSPDGGRVPRRVVRELTAQLQQELQKLFDEAESRSAAGA